VGVNWYKQRALLEIEDATDDLLLALALRGEGKAKINITDNDQIDTGFMRNAIYAVGPGQSNYHETQPSGFYTNTDGEQVARERLPETVEVKKHEAAIVVAAEYAVHQEMRQSFLYKALEQLKGEEFKAAVKSAALKGSP